MEWFDILIVAFIFGAITLILWAQIEKKSIKEVLLEIRDIINEFGKEK